MTHWKKVKGWEDAYQKKSRSSYENPNNTFIYVAYERGKGWYFNYGQARINYKFHKNKEDALADMKKYMRLHWKMSQANNFLPETKILNITQRRDKPNKINVKMLFDDNIYIGVLKKIK